MHSELFDAIINSKEGKFRTITTSTNTAYEVFNYICPAGEHEGKSVAWLLAQKSDFKLLFDLLKKNKFSTKSINAIPKVGEDKNRSLLWIIANSYDSFYPEQILDMLFSLSAENYNSIATRGNDGRVSVLWIALEKKREKFIKWMLVKKDISYDNLNCTVDNVSTFLLLCKNMNSFSEKNWILNEFLLQRKLSRKNINAIYPSRLHEGKGALWFLVNDFTDYYRWDEEYLKKIILKTNRKALNSKAKQGDCAGYSFLEFLINNQSEPRMVFEFAVLLIKQGANISASVSKIFEYKISLLPPLPACFNINEQYFRKLKMYEQSPAAQASLAGDKLFDIILDQKLDHLASLSKCISDLTSLLSFLINRPLQSHEDENCKKLVTSKALYQLILFVSTQVSAILQDHQHLINKDHLLKLKKFLDLLSVRRKINIIDYATNFNNPNAAIIALQNAILGISMRMLSVATENIEDVLLALEMTYLTTRVTPEIQEWRSFIITAYMQRRFTKTKFDSDDNTFKFDTEKKDWSDILMHTIDGKKIEGNFKQVVINLHSYKQNPKKQASPINPTDVQAPAITPIYKFTHTNRINEEQINRKRRRTIKTSLG